MRRLILSALVLLPVLASAQTSTSAAARSSAPTLLATATPPAALPAAAAAAKPPAGDGSDIMVPVNQTVVDNGADSDSQASYVAPASTAPVLVHAVPVTLSLKDVRSEPATAAATVVVHLKVDSTGTPNSLAITRSAGAALDQRALSAISQYRFTPATQSGLPVDSEATISIQFKSR